MKYDKDKLCESTENIKKLFESNPLPSWDELPVLELYMDQVIILLKQYLKIFSAGADEDKFITPPMINNYVKLKIMPAPIKKKYGRMHMAYLIIICSLKQTLSMSTIQKIIPVELSENEIKEIYNAFTANLESAIKSTHKQIRSVTGLIDGKSFDDTEKINDLVMRAAISSNLTKLLAEMIVD
ncbi:MAG: DUF1836 domain-containing protein [Clostridia bacterium]|nr:DUF1836 domain-containing protein [Clostridia bacterium]